MKKILKAVACVSVAAAVILGIKRYLDKKSSHRD